MHNLLREKLRRKEVTFGITLVLGTPEIPEALANVGLDWMNFDMQHTTQDAGTLQPMIQATSYSKTVPIIRVISNDLGLINRALDTGAPGIIVPLVNSREDAEKAVRFAKYPPQGVRSYGIRSVALRDPEYTATANDEILIMPQIEAELALRNLEEIVTTDGIDAIFVGPYDLTLSLGVFRQFDSSKYLKAVEKVVSTCEAHDVAPGLLAIAGPMDRIVEQGFKLISLGGDLGFLVQNVTKALKDARSVVGTSETRK